MTLFFEPFDRATSGGASAQQHGAVGDGVTDDTQALWDTIAAADVNGTVLFTSGKTYLVSSSLVPLVGQTWLGYGATVKRADGVATTITQALTSGTPPGTVSVASVAGFRVGMLVTFHTVADPTITEAKNWSITAIGASSLTLVGFSPLLAGSYASGDVLTTAYDLIAEGSGTAGLQLIGLTIDGNRANNPHGRWEMCASIRLNADRGLVQGNYIHDSMSDGIIFTGNGATIADNVIINSGGNGIHLGGTLGTRVINNHVENYLLNGDANGHPDGGIIASSAVYDTILVGNYVTTGNGYTGFAGSWDSTDNFGLEVTGNYAVNCGRAFTVAVGVAATQGRVNISGNVFINCGRGIINGGGAWSTINGVAPITVSCNYFESTGIEVQSSQGLVMSGNAFYKRGDVAGGTLTSTILLHQSASGVVFNSNTMTDTDDVAHFAINLVGTVGATISNNAISGFGWGIYVEPTGGSFPSNNMISTNALSQQANVAVEQVSGCDGNSVINNTIVSDKPSGSNVFLGIRGCQRGLISGNNIRITGHANAGISSSAGSSSITGALITNNFIMADTNWPIILTGRDQYVLQNFLQNSGNGGTFMGTVLDSGTSNTVSGNVTVQ